MAMGDSIKLNFQLSIPKDSFYSKEKRRKFKKNRKPSGTVGTIKEQIDSRNSYDSTSKKIEILHQGKIDNWRDKSNSTLAMSEEFNYDSNTRGDDGSYELKTIEILHEKTTEQGNNTSMSTLALSEETIYEMNTNVNQTEKKITSSNRNRDQIQEESSQNQNQDQIQYICLVSENRSQGQIQEDPSLNTENDEQLTEKDSILELYKSLEYMDYPAKSSTNNSAPIDDYCGAKCQDGHNNNDFSIRTKKSLTKMGIEDSILRLYLNID